MALCTKCEEQMVSDKTNKCRDCILDDHENLVQDLVKAFQNQELRRLMIVHSEARNRIIKNRKEDEEDK